ncbi:MAG: hypothetical protein ACTS7I_02945 [Candidatus Hodgkinia cicadicola]
MQTLRKSFLRSEGNRTADSSVWLKILDRESAAPRHIRLPRNCCECTNGSSQMNWTFKLLDANRGANGHLKDALAEIVA